VKRRPLCPMPDKRGYASMRRARDAARNVAMHVVAQGEHFGDCYGYLCVCERWHLTELATAPDGTPNVLLKHVPDQLQEWAQTPAEGSGAFVPMADDDVERFVL
jgi:hypothetical protein